MDNDLIKFQDLFGKDTNLSNMVETALVIDPGVAHNTEASLKGLFRFLVDNNNPNQIASLFRKVCLDYEYEAIQEAFKGD